MVPSQLMLSYQQRQLKFEEHMKLMFSLTCFFKGLPQNPRWLRIQLLFYNISIF